MKDTAAFGAKTVVRQILVKGDKMTMTPDADWPSFIQWGGPFGLRAFLQDWDKRAQKRPGGLGRRRAAKPKTK